MSRSAPAHHAASAATSAASGAAPSNRYRASSPSGATTRPGRPRARVSASDVSSAGDEPSVQAEPEPPASARSELVRRPGGDHPPRVDDHDPVGESLHIGEVVARQQDRRARFPFRRHDRPGRGTCLRVHAGGRLVEDEHLRTPDERQGQAEPLSLAARQEPVARPGDAAQADEVDQLVGVARVRVEASELDQRLAWPGPRVDAAALEHQADPGTQRAPAAGWVRAQDAHPATIRLPVSLDDLDGRRLARAVRPEQRDELPGTDFERDAIHDRAVAVSLDQPLDDDRRAATGHELIFANDRSKSASVSSPTWIARMTPSPSTK